MVTSNYPLNKGIELDTNQFLKPVNQKKIEYLESCCSKWAERISKWSLAAKVATFILTLPFAPVLLPLYATTRLADNQTKKIIKNLKRYQITAAKEKLFNKQDLQLNNFATFFQENFKKGSYNNTVLNALDLNIQTKRLTQPTLIKQCYNLVLQTYSNDETKALQFFDSYTSSIKTHLLVSTPKSKDLPAHTTSSTPQTVSEINSIKFDSALDTSSTNASTLLSPSEIIKDLPAHTTSSTPQNVSEINSIKSDSALDTSSTKASTLLSPSDSSILTIQNHLISVREAHHASEILPFEYNEPVDEGFKALEALAAKIKARES